MPFYLVFLAGDRLADSTITLALALEPLSDHAPSFTSNPDMEPIKVQSEGGLNVTLTIRLLMHGKVRKHRKVLGDELNFLFCNAGFISNYLSKEMRSFQGPLWHKYT